MMEELIEIIKTSDNIQLANKLEQDPSLADSKTDQGISLLQFAAYCRNAEAVRILKEHTSNINIFEAAALGDVEKVNQFLDENPDLVNSHSADGFTALGLAAFFGHLLIADELIGLDSNPNIASNNSFKVTPLHSACASSNLEMASLLINHGADVNAKQMHGVTPIHSAAHNGQSNLIKLLVDHGADINSKMDDGKTPLSMAEEANFKETANLIRQLGGV